MKRVLVMVALMGVSMAVCFWVAGSRARPPQGPWRPSAPRRAQTSTRTFVPLSPGAPAPTAAAAPLKVVEPEGAGPIETRSYPTPEASVVFNEICYHAPGGDRRDEWIELHNRSDKAVDMSGWKLAGGVQFTFPAGTKLEPGAFLIVGADRARLRDSLGLETVLGDWTGSLDDSGESLELVTAEGMKGDALAYDDRPPFPVLPDGLGRTLERRSPHERTDTPANWGSSATGQARGGGWKKLSAKGLASSNRLYVYLLAAGIAYVDNVVVRDGNGQVVFHDDFESEPLRWTGLANHAASVTEAQGGAPGKGNRCLAVNASGAGSGRRASVYVDLPESITAQACELELLAHVPNPAVGFMARLSAAGRGTVGLSIELRGAESEERAFTASPGRPSSILAKELPPFAHPLAIRPERPTANDAVTISARFESSKPMKTAVLKWEEWGKAEKLVPLHDDGDPSQGDESREDGVWSVRVGPFPEGTLVLFSVTGEDGAGPTAVFPPRENPTKRVGFVVVPLEPEAGFPHYQVYLTADAQRDLDSNPFTDAFRPGVFVHEGRVWSDVGFRYRGHTSRGIPKHHWKVKFPRDNPFRPHPGHREVKGFNLNSAFGDPSYLREVLSYGLWGDLGEATCEAWHARLSLNGSKLGLYVHLENPGRDYLKRNRLEEGWLWKAYSDGYSGAFGFELKAGDPATAQTQLDQFLRSIASLEGEALDAYLTDHLNVDSFVTFLAACQVVHSADHVQKNYLIHATPDGKFTFLPWDMDLTHGRNFECSGGGIWNDVIRWDMWDPQYRDSKLLFGTAAHRKCDGWVNAVIDAFLNRTAAFRPRFYERVAEILSRHYHPDVLLPKIERWRKMLREEAVRDLARWPSYASSDFDQAYKDLERWTRRRFEHLQAKLKALGVQVAPPLNADFSADIARGPAPLKVTFRNLSVGKFDSCQWDFGDGEASTEREPLHAYSKPGRFDVTLKITGPSGTHAQARKDAVFVWK